MFSPLSIDPERLSRRFVRGASCLAAIGFGLFATTVPAMSASPFDFLFKPASAPPPSVEAYAAPATAPVQLFQSPAPKLAAKPRPLVRALRQPAAPAAQAPVRDADDSACCMPADDATAVLLKDPTLRPGDAVVTSDGIRIFEGPVSARHTIVQFTPLSRAKNVSAAARTQLAGLDAPAGKLLSAQASAESRAKPQTVAERPKTAGAFAMANR